MGWGGGCAILLKALSHQLGEVGDGACEHASEDEVEFLRVSPRIFCIVDVECEVRGRAGRVSCGYGVGIMSVQSWLDGTEINANDLIGSMSLL